MVTRVDYGEKGVVDKADKCPHIGQHTLRLGHVSNGRELDRVPNTPSTWALTIK